MTKIKLKGTEKRFMQEFCDGCEDGPFYKDDILAAFRMGRYWNVSSIFMDVNKFKPSSKTWNDNIVVILQLGDELPYSGEFEFTVIKVSEYEDFIKRTPYKPLYWFRLANILSMLKRKEQKRDERNR